jgi:WD40 repeat protein
MCSEGLLKLWSAQDISSDFSLKSELHFGRTLQEEVCLKSIGESHLMLLSGGYDSKVHVYCTSRDAAPSELKYHFSLLGHFNSIKSIQFSEDMANSVNYLATGSQDQNIRIWKL